MMRNGVHVYVFADRMMITIRRIHMVIHMIHTAPMSIGVAERRRKSYGRFGRRWPSSGKKSSYTSWSVNSENPS